jgi:hypothetical protein
MRDSDFVVEATRSGLPVGPVGGGAEPAALVDKVSAMMK